MKLNLEKIAKYPIGLKFQTQGKAKYIETITDIQVVINSKGEIVRHYYISEYDFMGQHMTHEVNQMTLDRAKADKRIIESEVQ